MSKTAFVFAGQGAQFVGMGCDLADTLPSCRQWFDRASAVLGYDLAGLCSAGPMETLTRTDRCQPAIFVVSVACAEALQTTGAAPIPVATAGLSLGEWTALYAAGAIGFEEAVRALDLRGRAMQAACDASAGGMISVIGLSLETLIPLAAAAGVQVANINSVDQIVLSGTQAALTQAAAAAQTAGARKVIPLKVAGAYHSALMAPAAEKLAALLENLTFQTPSVPVLSNVSGRPHGRPDQIGDAMVAQVVSSVRWMDNVQWLLDQGVQTFIEFGPGKVLGGLIKRLDNTVTVANIQDRVSLEACVALLAAQ